MVRIKTRLGRSRSSCLQSLTSSRKRNVSPKNPHSVLSVHCVRSESRPRALTENTPNRESGNPEHIPVVEFDNTFATDTPGSPNISMMVARDSTHGSFLLLWQGEKVAKMIT